MSRSEALHSTSQRTSASSLDRSRRDARGNTPLHHAAASPGQAQRVQDLLDRGADPNAVGSYGTRPLTSALWAHEKRSAALLRAHGAVPEVGPLNEPSARSYLASVMGISGVTLWDGQALELQGALEPGVYPLLAAAWRRFCAQDAVDTPLAVAVLHALEQAIPRACGAAAATQAAVEAGEEVILPTGVRGHALTAVLTRDVAVLVDRNFRGTWRLLRAPRAWRLRCMVSFLKHNRLRSFASGMLRLAALTRTLQARRHRLQPAFDACGLKTIHASNCAIANAKAAILALLLCKTDPQAARALYKRFTAFLRYDTLLGYLRAHARRGGAAMDGELVARCLRKAEAGGRLPATWVAALQAASASTSTASAAAALPR